MQFETPACNFGRCHRQFGGHPGPSARCRLLPGEAAALWLTGIACRQTCCIKNALPNGWNWRWRDWA